MQDDTNDQDLRDALGAFFGTSRPKRISACKLIIFYFLKVGAHYLKLSRIGQCVRS